MTDEEEKFDPEKAIERIMDIWPDNFAEEDGIDEEEEEEENKNTHWTDKF